MLAITEVKSNIPCMQSLSFIVLMYVLVSFSINQGHLMESKPVVRVVNLHRSIAVNKD